MDLRNTSKSETLHAINGPVMQYLENKLSYVMPIGVGGLQVGGYAGVFSELHDGRTRFSGIHVEPVDSNIRATYGFKNPQERIISVGGIKRIRQNSHGEPLDISGKFFSNAIDLLPFRGILDMPYSERVSRTYEFGDRSIGELVQVDSRGRTEFRTDLSVTDAIDLVYELSPEQRTHMRSQAYAVHRLLEHHGLNPDDYITNEDIMIAAANKGLGNLTDLNRRDSTLWRLVKQRGLEGELFEGFDGRI